MHTTHAALNKLIFIIQIAGLFLCNNTMAQPPLLPPGFIVKWDISHAGNTLSLPFEVSELQQYRSELIFSPISRPFGAHEQAELTGFVGDGTFDINQGTAAPSLRPNAQGIIPIHIRILKVNAGGDTSTLLDTTVQTQGMTHASGLNKALLLPTSTPLNPHALGGTFRAIYELPLKPGSYILSTTTTQDTAVPTGLETILSVSMSPNTTTHNR